MKASSLNIILPVGISFYTFQTLSYTIDVYRRKLEPTKDFAVFSAFVSFFPQLVAGPIERATNLLPQFYKDREFNYTQADIDAFFGADKKGTNGPSEGDTKEVDGVTFVFKNGKWGNVEELPFNKETYSTGHPTLSEDQKTLYFISDMPGGFGETDIYKAAILGNDMYGKPENLGKKINTSGKEMFPFIAKDNTLYFSSNGYKNLGLLDIYKSDSASHPTNHKLYPMPTNDRD